MEPLKVSVISSSLLYLIVMFSGNKPIKLEGIRYDGIQLQSLLLYRVVARIRCPK